MKRPGPSESQARRPRQPLDASPDFPADLVIRGYRPWGRMSVDPKKHVMWSLGGAPAFDAAAIDEWMRNDLSRIVVRFRRETRPALSIALVTFLAHASVFDRGHGRQYACHRKFWVEDDDLQPPLFAS